MQQITADRGGSEWMGEAVWDHPVYIHSQNKCQDKTANAIVFESMWCWIGHLFPSPGLLGWLSLSIISPAVGV